jgi:hypothetical protein
LAPSERKRWGLIAFGKRKMALTIYMALLFIKPQPIILPIQPIANETTLRPMDGPNDEGEAKTWRLMARDPQKFWRAPFENHPTSELDYLAAALAQK